MFGWLFGSKDGTDEVELPTLVKLPEYTPESAKQKTLAVREAKKAKELKAIIERVNHCITVAVEEGVYGTVWSATNYGGYHPIPIRDEELLKTVVKHFVDLGWKAELKKDRVKHSYGSRRCFQEFETDDDRYYSTVYSIEIIIIDEKETK